MTFTSSFLASSLHGAAPLPFSSPHQQNGTGNTRTIAMIVDDESKTAELLSLAFIDSGIPTVYTTSSNDAIAMALRERPRVILMDLLLQQRLRDIGPIEDLPEIEREFISKRYWGAILVRRMQQMPELSGTVLMIMSCLRPRLPGMGDIPFISKPFFDIQGMVRRVRASAGMD